MALRNKHAKPWWAALTSASTPIRRVSSGRAAQRARKRGICEGAGAPGRRSACALRPCPPSSRRRGLPRGYEIHRSPDRRKTPGSGGSATQGCSSANSPERADPRDSEGLSLGDLSLVRSPFQGLGISEDPPTLPAEWGRKGGVSADLARRAVTSSCDAAAARWAAAHSSGGVGAELGPATALRPIPRGLISRSEGDDPQGECACDLYELTIKQTRKG
eukprot:gene6742-biopygen12243